MNNIQKQPKYTIKKLSIGVASCLIGFAFFEPISGTVHAEEETVLTDKAHSLESVTETKMFDLDGNNIEYKQDKQLDESERYADEQNNIEINKIDLNADEKSPAVNVLGKYINENSIQNFQKNYENSTSNNPMYDSELKALLSEATSAIKDKDPMNMIWKIKSIVAKYRLDVISEDLDNYLNKIDNKEFILEKSKQELNKNLLEAKDKVNVLKSASDALNTIKNDNYKDFIQKHKTVVSKNVEVLNENLRFRENIEHNLADIKAKEINDISQKAVDILDKVGTHTNKREINDLVFKIAKNLEAKATNENLKELLKLTNELEKLIESSKEISEPKKEDLNKEKEEAARVINNALQEKLKAISEDKRYTKEERTNINKILNDYATSNIEKIQKESDEKEIIKLKNEVVNDVTHYEGAPFSKPDAKESIKNQQNIRIGEIKKQTNVTADQIDQAIELVNKAAEKANKEIEDADTDENVEHAKAEGLYAIQKINAANQPKVKPDVKQPEGKTPDKKQPAPKKEQQKEVIPGLKLQPAPKKEQPKEVIPGLKLQPAPKKEQQKEVIPGLKLQPAPKKEQQKEVIPGLKLQPAPKTEDKKQDGMKPEAPKADMEKEKHETPKVDGKQENKPNMPLDKHTKESKENKEAKPEMKKENKASLPQTGEVVSFGTAAMAVLTGLGLAIPGFKRKDQ
ncbi:DUF1542 domain-containing protein [Atopobacter phocae]|uniref:DUF1542 domain-containing protein n=1 Tax=Atopobacter phocae TaxID=136492 RepID=UPI000471D169|nr:DUF1542 domain-containing protein [Atopobacter phocae]